MVSEVDAVPEVKMDIVVVVEDDTVADAVRLGNALAEGVEKAALEGDTVRVGGAVGEGVTSEAMTMPCTVRARTLPAAPSQEGYNDASTPDAMSEEGMSCVTLPLRKQAAVDPPRRIWTLSKAYPTQPGVDQHAC